MCSSRCSPPRPGRCAPPLVRSAAMAAAWNASERGAARVVEAPKKRRVGTTRSKWRESGPTCAPHCHVGSGPKPWTSTTTGRRPAAAAAAAAPFLEGRIRREECAQKWSVVPSSSTTAEPGRRPAEANIRRNMALMRDTANPMAAALSREL
ncbi:hypothetical protein EE612_000478 [Oryza sativa]|nr:hypothetical protein EE612_000478 [Oryza sativa]